jgi:hypothetical protein
MRKKILFALLSLLLLPLGLRAQNVTIKSTNGSTVPAIKNGGATDTFFGAGGFATWQHEQLCMVLTTSDGTVLTQYNQLDNPANNLFTSGNCIQIGKGQASSANVCYVSLSLPSGYRFTGYEIKFSKSTETKTGTSDDDETIEIPFDSPVTSRFGETGSDFATYVTQADVTNGGGFKTITRQEGAGGTMGNVLYFKLMNTTTDEGEEGYYEGVWPFGHWVEGRDANNRALITLESAEFFFTSEENFAPVTPAGEIASPVSAVDIPFSTSKVDYGAIANHTYTIDGKSYTRISYESKEVTDLEANFVLYEAESTKDNQTHFDGTTGKVVDYKEGTISSNGGYFQLGRANQEQVYYIESPTYVELSDEHSTKNPVGYRIVEAELEYTKSIGPVRTFYITYTYNGNKRYLNTDGRFRNTQVRWEMDEDGYISSGGYYLYFNNSRAATSATKPGDSETFDIDENDNIFQKNYPTYFIRGNRVSNQNWECLISPDNYTKAVYEEISHTDVSDFELYIYDQTGATNTKQTIPVSKHGKTKLRGLNNDAVKFGVKGIGLVRATLTLQALDPYLYSMNVVCQDQQPGFEAIRMTQNFTASDFSVSGGVFHFFMPTGTEGHGVKITFEDLVSNYFDDTYTGGSANHTSRINFVKSAHFNEFGNGSDNVNNIYTNKNEAANATKERLKVGIVGTKPFIFNNAATVGSSGGTLTEYPFTLARYAAQASPNNGSFSDMTFTVSTEDQEATRYVFTTDETRYNIAPTTAVQHRAYAYYEMEVHVMTGNYDPKIEFVKVYDKTFYYNTETGKEDTGAFYGVKVTAVDDDGNPGYASTIAISDHIDNILTVTKEDDFGHTDLPTSQKQILYIDFSDLKGMYMMTDEDHPSMEAMLGDNAANCLIFLPQGSSAPNDNVAYKMESGNFHAANNIVITDKQPFYSPYQITVGDTKTATYSRQITFSDYGKDKNATILLPFNIKIENGVHKTPDGNWSFEVNQLKPNSQITASAGSEDYGIGYFEKVSGTETTANKVYMVRALDVPAGTNDLSFKVEQLGATIMPTPAKQTISGISYDGWIFQCDENATSVTFKGNGAAFTNYASLSGAVLDHSNASGTYNVFYFGNNQFVNMNELSANQKKLYAFPFRGFYNYTLTGSSREFNLKAFDISYDEPQNDITSIDELNNVPDADLMIRTGKGSMTITASKAQEVTIYSANGTCVAKANMLGGDTQTVYLASGVYIVNNIKIAVK